jgi:transcriptional regulator with XRE-family HTH domain
VDGGQGASSTGHGDLVADNEAFGRFVRRAVDDAKNRRGWTVSRLAAETGIGRSTLFRWLAGDNQHFPELASVHSFCAALDIPVSAAFNALGVRQPATRGEDDDVRADIDRILRRLSDPSVGEAEKVVIRDMLRYLGRRADEHGPATAIVA